MFHESELGCQHCKLVVEIVLVESFLELLPPTAASGSYLSISQVRFAGLLCILERADAGSGNAFFTRQQGDDTAPSQVRRPFFFLRAMSFVIIT